MNRLVKKIVPATSLLAASLLPQLASAKNHFYYYHEPTSYTFVIQNITDATIDTPFVVATSSGFKLFELGEPASDGLKEQARSGATGPLKEEFAKNPQICQVGMTDGLLRPGERVEITLAYSKYCYSYNLSAMFLPSNDGFVGIAEKYLPSYFYSKTDFANAYDAGAEYNSGACFDKPGPQCKGTGSDDANFRPDPLDFVRPFAPYTAEIAARAAILLDTTDANVDDIEEAKTDAAILGRAQFATPLVKVTVTPNYK